MLDGEVILDTPDGPMAVYEAVPDSPSPTAVIVVQEAFGVNDHIKDVTRRFASAGHHAVAPAFFHRAGGGTAPYDDFNQVLPLYKGLTDDGVLTDVDAVIAYLEDQGFKPASIGIVGFCFGGRVTFLVSTRRALGAAVGFYGGGIASPGFKGTFPALIDDSAGLRTPWLGLFGDKDTGIPVEDVERLRTTLDAETTTEHAIVRYPEAEHGFHCDQRPSYHQASAQDAWSRTLAWFEARLAG